jgi:ATP phosphoribosyltransferase regulatory subunit
MTRAEATGSTLDARAEALVAAYARGGYARVTPAVLQPAEAFLDLSGEEIRARMFLTSDAAGNDFCLRPDFTIPVAQAYLASPKAGTPQGFSYLGPVFRDRGGEPGEILQAGIESFGRSDIAAADAEMLSLGLEASAHFGLPSPDIRIGDVGLFGALVTALDLAPAWRRRLVKDFNRKTNLTQDLDRLTLGASNAGADYQGVLAALAGSDPKAAHALVTDLLSIAGITTVGGRTVGEIADRFLEQSALGASAALPKATRGLIESFLGIAGNPDDALAQLRKLAGDAKIAVTPALDLLETRIGFLAARGVDLDRVRFASAFGRGMDYYSGFVFEMHDPSGRMSGPLVAGGRYDGMLQRLGAKQTIPAVGFSAWIERLSGIGGAR